MRKKLPDEEKKQKITLSINEKINELLEIQVERHNIKKSQLIENILKEHFKNIKKIQ